MRKKDWIMLILAIAAIGFSVWWYGFAPCEKLIKASWSLKDVPTRCFSELK